MALKETNKEGTFPLAFSTTLAVTACFLLLNLIPPAGEGPGVGESAGERAPAAGRAAEEALRHCRGSSGSAVRGQRRRPREAQSFDHVAQTQQTSAHEETSAGTEAHLGTQSHGKKMFQSGV